MDKDRERQAAKLLVIGTFIIAGLAILGGVVIFIALMTSNG